MKIAYVAPYAGEEEIVKELMPEHEYIFYPTPIRDNIPNEISDVEVLSVFVDSKVTKEMIDALPNLKVIALRSTGFDHIDVAYAQSKNIIVSYVPHYGSQTVAEHTFSLILALSRQAYPMYQLLRTEGSLDVVSHEGFDISGKTIGVIGTGAIGKRVCEIAHGFRMNIKAFDLFPDQTFASAYGFEYLSLEEVLAGSDIVTLHVPATAENHHLINEKSLSKMKKGAIVINTARGTLIDTVALVKALKSGHLYGAGLDVYEGEEYMMNEMKLIDGNVDLSVWKAFAAEHELLDMKNVIMTPHMAFNTKEAKREITETTLNNISDALIGAPKFVVKIK
jgi:D-lactate dehydrogenase